MSGVWFDHAVREINRTYGDRVSYVSKAKSLSKFGLTTNADAGVATTVAEFQGGVVNETYVTSNSIDYVVSDSPLDTGALIYEGHFLNNGGLLFFRSEVVLNGQTPVKLPIAGARANRAFVKNGTLAAPASDIVGNVAFYASSQAGGVTGGVPNTATATKLYMPGRNQTQKCATALAANNYWLTTGVRCSIVTKAGAPVVTFDVEYREIGGVWRPQGLQLTLNNETRTESVPFKPFVLVPKNSDVRMVANSDTNNVTVSGRMFGLLAEVF